MPREALTSCIKEENKNLSIIKNNGQPDVHGQPDVQQTMEVMIEEPGNNNSGNNVNDDDNNDEAMEIVPPSVLPLAIKTKGKKKASHEELKLSQLLPMKMKTQLAKLLN